ncbi:hypothetical protein RB653_000087 [Dictyostelium firmibasis]|uniref:Uncharacterized protein n=1 Tax=Dictyostelium firmibasis TaxID=79012 RepID=A0AAN7TUL2_9MYCE
MFRSLSNKLRYLTASPYVLFPTLVLAFFVFNLMSTKIMSQLNINLLDSYLLGYTKTQAIQTLELLGPKGRDLYMTMYTSYYDIIFPILLAIIVISMLSKTYPIFGYENNRSFSDLYNLVPIFGLIFDELENFCHYQILKYYPSSTIDSYIYFGSYFCLFKYVFIFFGIFILVIFDSSNNFNYNKTFISFKKRELNKDKDEEIIIKDSDFKPYFFDFDGIANNDQIVSTTTTPITTNTKLNNNGMEKTIGYFGKRIDDDMETEFKPKLLKLLQKLKLYSPRKDQNGSNDAGIRVTDSIIDSLTFYPSLQNQAEQNKLAFFGELCFRHSISDPAEFSFSDKLLFEEFRECVKGQYFLRERCVELGLSEFIRFQMNTKLDYYQSIYEAHYAYRCLIKFIGAIYLQSNFKTARKFIHSEILQQPEQPLETFILNKPESVLIKNFSNYKLEPPIIKTFSPKRDFPFHTTIIKTGTSEVSRGYGITKDESYNFAIELLNSKSSSFASLMSLMFSKLDKNNVKDKILK